MSKIKNLIVSFPASESPDVVGYKLYLEEASRPVGYESPAWDLGNVTEIDLSILSGMTTRNGAYNLGVVAIDGAGNESSMSIIEGVALDFVAPDPPGPVVIERS